MSNLRFEHEWISFTTRNLISWAVDSETLLVTDFVNLKIKPTQFSRGVHKNTIYITIFIGVDAHIYTNIYYLYYVLKKRPSRRHTL
jgi:hypothetical protein